jgi:hypothetical protein
VFAWLALAVLGTFGLIAVLRQLFTSAIISDNGGFWAWALILSVFATGVGLFELFNT